MDKKKIGLYFYYFTIVVALILFIYSNFNLKSDNMDVDELTRYKNLLNFIVFAFVLPLGVIVREFFILEYKKKLMIFKIIASVITIAFGILLWFVIPTAKASQMLLYVSFFTLMFILVPTNAYGKKTV